MSTLTKTVPLLMLHNELTRLKDTSGVKDPEAGAYLGCAHTKINRIMNMTSKPNAGDVKMLGEVYGADEELIKVLIDLARNLGKKGQWSGYKSVYDHSTRMLVDLEQHADRISQAQAEIIPGLLQGEAYIRALCQVPSPSPKKFSEDDVVKSRQHRQSILERGVTAAFVLSESTLRRVIGSRAVMREQMEWLIRVAKLPNVQLQIRPFEDANQISYAWLSFEMIHVPGKGIASPLHFVQIEQFDDHRYIDDPDAVEGFERLWSNLQAAALGPVESINFIRKVAEEYK